MTIIRTNVLLAVLGISMLLTGCGGGGGQAQGKTPPDYKTVKTMVLDIMQTEDAKKALSKVMRDETFKQSMIMDETMIRSTLLQSLGNPQNPLIKEAFRDPKFAGELAKIMKNEHKALIKDLMKDPEYQKMMIGVMKDPEFERHLIEVMKSSAYRQQTMQIMKEALQSPLFQAEMVNIMTKAAEEMITPRGQKKRGGGEQEQSGQSGGGGGEGGSGSS